MTNRTRRAGHPAANGRDRECGSVTVELVILAPIFLALLCLVVGLGRMDETRGQVDGAARDAARAASLARTPGEAITAGKAAASADLSGTGATCRAVAVTVDTDQFAPAGLVTVHVTCTTRLSDVTISGLPGSKTFTATATAPLDTYRGITT